MHGGTLLTFDVPYIASYGLETSERSSTTLVLDRDIGIVDMMDICKVDSQEP
jgi:hypothetical protein